MRGLSVLIGLVLLIGLSAPQAAAQTLDVSGWYGEPRYTHFTTALADAAADALPDVTLQFRTNPGLDSLLTMLAGDALPDVITVHHASTFPGMVNQGALIPLDDYLERDGSDLWEIVPPDLLSPFQRDGKLYAIPAVAELNHVFVNNTMLAEAGLDAPGGDWTWDDLLEMSRAITQDISGDGEIDAYGTAIRQYEQEIGPFIYAHGGAYMNAQADGTEVLFDSRETIEAMEFVRSLIHDHRVAVPTWERERWDQGNLGFYFTGTWNFGTFQEAIGDAFEWDYIHYPRSPETGERAARLSVIGIAVSRNTEHPDEAVRVAQLAAEAVTQEAFLAAGLSPIPVRQDLFGSEFMPDPTQMPRSASQTIMETLTDGEAYADTVYPDDRMAPVTIEFIEQVLFDGVSPEIAMPEAARQMRLFLEEAE